MPEAEWEKLELLRARKEEAAPGLRITVSDILRMAIARGIDELTEEVREDENAR